MNDERKLRSGEHLSLAAFWFGTNTLWTAFLVSILADQSSQLSERGAGTQGLIMAVGAVFALIVPLLVGPLSDRCASPLGRRRPFIGVGVIVNLFGLGLLYLAFQARSIPGYIGAYCFMQLGNNVATGAYQGVIPDHVPLGQRGVASGFMAMMTQLGAIVGALSLVFLYSKGLLGLEFLFLGLVLVVTAAVTWFGMKEVPLKEKPAPLNIVNLIKGLWINPKEHPDFAWVWITRALVMAGFYTVQPFLQGYLRDVIKVENASEAQGKMILIVLVFAMFSGIIGGAISDKIGRKKIVYWANGIMAVTALAFPFCHTLTEAMIIAVIFGIGYGAYISVDWALGTDVLPNKNDAGKDMAVWHIAMVLPQTLLTPIAGAILELVGGTVIRSSGGEAVTHYHTTGYFVIFGMAAVLLTLGALLLRNVKGAR